MDLHTSPAFTRRQFLSTGLTLASAAVTVPHFISASAFGMPRAAGLSSIPGAAQDRILVVVQLSGGNDGLNTVVPYGADEYYKARPAIGIQAKDVLKLAKADGVGLHPQMTALRDLYDEGLLAIVQGVGYPNPNRSHFKSMDIWHTADTDATGDGWLGRYFDSECCGYGKGESGRAEQGARPNPGGAAAARTPEASATPGIALGRTAPLAMQGRSIKPISFETEDLFRWIGQDVHPALAEPYDRLERRETPAGMDPHSNAAFLMRTALDAQVSSDLIRKAVRSAAVGEYPRTELGRQLAMVASMIRAGLPTRVYYVQLGGFDTHAGQGGPQGRHANLLSQFASAMKAFRTDLKKQENDGRVLTMSFSEFGRRVGQNASGGTDHGTAAPLFLVGPMVKPGVLSEHPSLTDLDEGDLKFRVDFRAVYAGILQDWMKADAKKILGADFKPAPVIKKA